MILFSASSNLILTPSPLLTSEFLNWSYCTSHLQYLCLKIFFQSIYWYSQFGEASVILKFLGMISLILSCIYNNWFKPLFNASNIRPPQEKVLRLLFGVFGDILSCFFAYLIFLLLLKTEFLGNMIWDFANSVSSILCIFAHGGLLA